MKIPALAHFGLAALALAGLGSSASAQLSYTTLGLGLVENFTNPSGWGIGNSTSVAWSDNTTVPGWYASYYVAGTDTYTTPANYIQSNGTQNTSHSLYIFKSNTDSTTQQDGALGAFPINSQTGGGANLGGVFYGTRIVNNTGTTLTEFTLSYILEMWRLSNGSAANSVSVSYRVGGTTFGADTASWVAIPSLTTTSPAGPASGSAAQNGNLLANQVASSIVTVNGISVATGDSLWVRWYDLNESGVDNGIGIDNVTFSAIPEPSTYAAFAAAGALGLALLRRRRA